MQVYTVSVWFGPSAEIEYVVENNEGHVRPAEHKGPVWRGIKDEAQAMKDYLYATFENINNALMIPYVPTPKPKTEGAYAVHAWVKSGDVLLRYIVTGIGPLDLSPVPLDRHPGPTPWTGTWGDAWIISGVVRDEREDVSYTQILYTETQAPETQAPETQALTTDLNIPEHGPTLAEAWAWTEKKTGDDRP